MKATNHSPHPIPFLTGSTLLALLIGFSPLSASAQEEEIVIEGGPEPVHIADEDGEIENVRPLPESLQSDPPAGATTTEEPPEAVTIQPVPDDETTVRVPVEEAEEEAYTPVADTSVSAVNPPAEADREPLDPEVQAQLEQLERQLGIAEAAAEAQVIFEANDVFEEGAPDVAEFAEDEVDNLAAYMKLKGAERATVRYHYLADGESEQEARARSAAFVNQMKLVEELSAIQFDILTPEVVEREVPESGKPGQIVDTYVPLLEVNIL